MAPPSIDDITSKLASVLPGKSPTTNGTSHVNGTSNGKTATNGDFDHKANGTSTLNGNVSNGHISSGPASPFDPLAPSEITKAVAAVRADYTSEGSLFMNAVTLREPRKADMLAWLDDPTKPEPKREADIVAIGEGSKVYDGTVDLSGGEAKLTEWKYVEGVQPLITMEDLKAVEEVCRKDPGVIEQCGILGIPAEDMHKVYCDAWTIGYDERFGSSIRLQQALMYYRPHMDDSQYTYPLDFCPIYNCDTQKIIHIDVPEKRRPLNKLPPSNYTESAIAAETDDKWLDLKPINITQPEGVSFNLTGRQIKWANWNFHIGFNYREGIVLNNITFTDRDKGNKARGIFYRLSLSEMVVPYGEPTHPHHRKHAFDLGEYGAGYMTNSLKHSCDCKGAITYLPAHFTLKSGGVETIENAICIHEEDTGILFKHTDFRDDSVTVTRGRKLVVSQVFTAANYEYAVYWNFHLDGTISLDIKLTGILNTYALAPDEDTRGYGTQVYPGVNAHNHQHLFCLRIDPNIDGPLNSVFTSDAVSGDEAVGSKENPYGNAFKAKKTRFETMGEGWADYNWETGRTWDMVNENVMNENSGKPVGYKIVSREVPKLLPKEGSLVWKRAGFARHALHVTKYSDDQLYPAGRHVPQTSGEPNPHNTDLPAWMAADPTAKIANADVVVHHTFGVTHFPAPEDYPVMPAEPMGVLLRPRHFFKRNPALDVKPQRSTLPSKVVSGVV